MQLSKLFYIIFHLVHAIKVPLVYNFLNYVVEKEYSKYITIIPNDHNKELLLNFSISKKNVDIIRNGIKDEYCLRITVSEQRGNQLKKKYK